MDSTAGAWAAIEGQEIVNLARTTRYLLNGFGPPGLQVLNNCDCDEEQVRTLVGCDPLPWESPAIDPAPWYDPAIPESADFAGFYPTTMDGLDSTYTREVTEVLTGGGGGVLGRLRAKPRTLVWHGFLFGRTCCSVAYGLRWLTAVLRQSRCGAECGGEKLDLLICCPPVNPVPWVWCESRGSYMAALGPVPFGYVYPTDNTPNFSSLLVPLNGGIPGNGTINVGSRNSPLACTDEIHIDRVSYEDPDSPGPPAWCCGPLGLAPVGPNLFVEAAGPTFTSSDPPPTWDPRSVLTGTITQLSTEDCDCTSLPNPGVPADGDAFRTLYNTGLVQGPLVRSQRKSNSACGCSTIMEIEFSIAAGNPHLYQDPTVIADCVPFGATGVCPTWVQVPPDVCPPPEPGVPQQCDSPVAPITTDPNCITPSLPPVFNVIDTCFCDPLVPLDLCFAVPASIFGQAFQGVPVFQVYAGSTPLHSTTIRLVENPLDLACDVVSADPCNFCDFITIRYIPAFATLTVDGVNRRVTIELPGGDVQAGEQFMVGNFSWPVLECIDYCVCATVDNFTAAADACFSMSIYPQEL